MTTQKPISPEEIGAAKVDAFPDHVIATWNRLIAQAFSSGSATILVKDAVEALMAAGNCSRAEVHTDGWLNIEDAYRAAGWAVEYDQPTASFTFKRGATR